MQPYVFIFVGRSGSGKGTQLELLQQYVREKNPSVGQKSLIMGDIYRTFFKEHGYVQDIARELSMQQGKFQPDFITNALFVYHAVHTFDGASHFFIDGYPRTISQLEVIKNLLAYVKSINPVVINLEVSRENVKKRMLLRKRGDDSESAVESRLNEYDANVVPVIAKIKSDSFFKYLEIDGEPSIEVIHQNIVSKLSI